MQLSIKQIQEFFCGVETWNKEDNSLVPLRFTEAQLQELAKNDSLGKHSRTSTGMRLCCETDAKCLRLDLSMFSKSDNDLYGYDLYVDGKLESHTEGYVSNGTEVKLCYSLSEGKKKIELFFPTFVGVKIKSVFLQDACYAYPVVQGKRLFCFGDSITQGYTVHFPSLSYTNIIARKLGLDLVNFAICGDTFHPDLIDYALKGKADFVIVAYGTNDWSTKELPAALCDAEAFYERICKVAEGVPVISIMPVWRADCQKQVPTGLEFDEWREILVSMTKKFPTIHVVMGEKLLPHIEELFEDRRIHPNEIGSTIYAERLVDEIMGILL